MTMGRLGKVDPISVNFYKPIEQVENFTLYLFIIAGILSFSPIFEDVLSPPVYEILQIGFLALVILLFVSSHVLRLYLIPRAEESRVRDFLSSAYGINLTQDTTQEYYNNEEQNPSKRVALQLLENLFFTKRISSEMIKSTRFLCLSYVFLWLVLILCREVNLGWIFIASQVLFSEEVLSKYIRLECLRLRTECLYNTLYRLFHTSIKQKDFEVYAFENFVIYEKVKAGLGVTLSSKLFNRLNHKLSVEWDVIRQPLENKRGR